MSFKEKKIKTALICLLSVIIFVTCSFIFYFYYGLSKVKITPISKTNEDLGIQLPSCNSGTANEAPSSSGNPSGTNPEVQMDENIVNIAFYGIDSRDTSGVGRSDAIIIVTIDKKHKDIKLSSIMRDTYVNIKGHGMDKITHAYAYGGPQLAIRTLNENFNLNIRDFVFVDFFSLEKIIDYLGGITMDIKEAEIPDLNIRIQEVANIEHVSAPLFTHPGVQQLNGMQAVAYARIRHTGNGDYERTDRQRKVLTALFEKIKEQGPIKYPFIVSQLLQYTETSMERSDILKLGAQIFTGNITTIIQQRFPLDDYSEGRMINSIWYLWTDLKATTNQIHSFIFDDIKP